jgi:hypothetical protein
MNRQQTVILKKAVSVFANFAGCLIVINVAVRNENIIPYTSVTHQLESVSAFCTCSEIISDSFATLRNVIAISITFQFKSWGASFTAPDRSVTIYGTNAKIVLDCLTESTFVALIIHCIFSETAAVLFNASAT